MDLLTSLRDDVTAVKRSKDQIDSQPRQSDFISPYYSGLINPLQSHGAGILALAQNFSPALHMSVCHLVIHVDCHTCHNSLLLPREWSLDAGFTRTLPFPLSVACVHVTYHRNQECWRFTATSFQTKISPLDLCVKCLPGCVCACTRACVLELDFLDELWLSLFLKPGGCSSVMMQTEHIHFSVFMLKTLAKL